MRILFVCSGNIFRSMSAEYLAKTYIATHHLQDVTVSSAGTTARPQPGYPETFARLRHHGADASQHQQRKATAALLHEQDLIICMAKHHQNTLKALGFDTLLYKELAEGTSEDVLDDAEYGTLHGYDFDLATYVDSIVDYLHETMPTVLQRALEDHKV